MATFDVRVNRKHLYTAPTKDFAEVDVPPLDYLAVDGHGDPNVEPAYAAAIEALYTIGYTLKFAGRKDRGEEMSVGPLEGLWRAEYPAAFVVGDKAAWDWTMVLPAPGWVDDAALADAVAAAAAKGRGGPSAGLVRLARLHEGRCVQILHVGPYSAEAPTLARLHDDYMPAHGLTFAGDHHEIYLSDSRRTAPERLRTILRQPVRPA